MWQGKDDVHVFDGQQFGHPGLQPTFLGQSLALGAVAVAAGAPQKTFSAAIGAEFTRAPQGWGAAAFDGPQGSELHVVQAAAGAETVAVAADEVCQLEPMSPPPAVRASRSVGHELLWGVE